MVFVLYLLTQPYALPDQLWLRISYTKLTTIKEDDNNPMPRLHPIIIIGGEGGGGR